LAHLTLFSYGLDRTGADEKQIQEIPAIEWQLFYLPLADELRNGGAVGVKRNGVGLDFYSLRDCTGPERDVGASFLSDHQADIFHD
jgi:hypothetical protein